MADSRKRRVTPEALGITLGVAGSMAGNVAWAAPKSAVLVGVGIGMSLVLPVAVALWRAIPAQRGTWAWWERTLVMACVVGGAALYSLVHTTLLLYGAGLPWSIAWVPAVVVELLVVMSARAGHVARTKAGADTSGQGAAPKAAARKPAAGRKAPAGSGSSGSPVPPPAARTPDTAAAAPSASARWERTRSADSGTSSRADTSADVPADETPAERRKRKDRERKARARATTKSADTSTDTSADEAQMQEAS